MGKRDVRSGEEKWGQEEAIEVERNEGDGEGKK